MTARIAILADDLIWGTRLTGLVRAGGADPVAVRTLAALETALPDVDGVVIDLTARAYDGIEAVTVARSARKLILVVGQHDDAALRGKALTAGAGTAVFLPYRRLTGDGVNLVAYWMSKSGIGESPT